MANKTKITEARARAFVPADGREAVLWDSIAPGLGLWVRPNGRKTWIVHRRRNGSVIRRTLGTLDTLTVEDARAAALAFLAREKGGGNPLLFPASGHTLTKFAAEYVERRSPSWKPSAVKATMSYPNSVILPALGHLRIGAVVPGDVARFFHEYGRRKPGGADRSVGIAVGAVFIAMAFLPKALAVVLAIPGPVAAAYIAVLLAMLFVVGMKMVVQDGIDYRKGLIAGIAFWAGVGFQSGVMFSEYFPEVAGGLLQNGMTAAGLVAILMTLFVEMTEPRRSRIETEFDPLALPKLREFLGAFASRSGWDTAMANRIDAAGEEVLLTLIRQDEAGEKHDRRRLLLGAHKEDGGAVLEFVATIGDENLQDRMALLGEQTDGSSVEREVSLRLLRHHASSVHHQQYHDTDIVTVRVEAPGPIRGGRS